MDLCVSVSLLFVQLHVGRSRAFYSLLLACLLNCLPTSSLSRLLVCELILLLHDVLGLAFFSTTAAAVCICVQLGAAYIACERCFCLLFLLWMRLCQEGRGVVAGIEFLVLLLLLVLVSDCWCT